MAFQPSSSSYPDMWTAPHFPAMYNADFLTGYPQDQYRAWSSSDSATVQQPFYPLSANTETQQQMFNNLGPSTASYYHSIALPTPIQDPWIINPYVFLPSHNSSKNLENNITPGDQVPPQYPNDASEIPSSVGPDRSARNERSHKKPYTRPRKKVIQDQMMDNSKVLVPPSPEIGVVSLPARGESPTLRQSRGGFASPDGRLIAVVEPKGIKHDPFSTVRPVAAKPGDKYRCRWEGCRYLVPATVGHMRAHMRHTHNIRGNTEIKCQWHPPIRVRIPGHNEPHLTSNHRLSYACNAKLQSNSLLNHIDSHLNHERQANPNVIECDSCGDGKVRRGNHRCAESR